jgi:eukaryotic-like serine/threonine-protein kinase
LGPEHPQTLNSMSNLAGVLSAERRLPESEKLNRETLNLYRRVLGPENPQALRLMHNLAFVLSLEGRYTEAEKLDREALDLRRRVLGPEHPATLETMRDLSVDLSRERRYAEAEKLIGDTINLSRRILGQENQFTASTVYCLGGIEARKGNRPKALSLLRQALDSGLNPSDALEMEKDPDLTSLHSDPRFIAMVAEVKQRAGATKP